ncbi:hypothetical protein FHS22_005327 [Planomonospora venezuelensis]|uniref:DUF5753 domain-containing protein n=2 Tax=Planomonospora venezuelensis TaxID=1999 RepID=A0A841DFM0_PLAVE|nr:hypothetical protein [Planomonospora venezuelensis]
MSDIRDLLQFYQVGRNERDEIIKLALLARKRPWWREYGDVFDTEYPGFENDASEIRVFCPLTLPVLLQTRRYAELQQHRLRIPAEQGIRLMETVRHRQRVLLRDDGTAPVVIAVITEAALRYDWGGVTDQLEQIVRLELLGGRPNIELRLHPFAAGGPPSPGGPVTHMRFPPDDAELVFAGTNLATTIVSDRRTAETYASQLSEVVGQACDRAGTIGYLAELTRTLSLREDRPQP